MSDYHEANVLATYKYPADKAERYYKLCLSTVIEYPTDFDRFFILSDAALFNLNEAELKIKKIHFYYAARILSKLAKKSGLFVTHRHSLNSRLCTTVWHSEKAFKSFLKIKANNADIRKHAKPIKGQRDLSGLVDLMSFCDDLRKISNESKQGNESNE